MRRVYCPLCGEEMERVEPTAEMHSSSMPDWATDRWACNPCNELWDTSATKDEIRIESAGNASPGGR